MKFDDAKNLALVVYTEKVGTDRFKRISVGILKNIGKHYTDIVNGEFEGHYVGRKARIPNEDVVVVTATYASVEKAMAFQRLFLNQAQVVQKAVEKSYEDNVDALLAVLKLKGDEVRKEPS